MSINSLLGDRLEKHKRHHLLRSLKSLESLKDFTSNDYLGFSRSKELKRQSSSFFFSRFYRIPIVNWPFNASK